MASDAPETNDQSQNQATAPAAATAPPAEPLAPGADPSDPPPPMTLSESRMPTRKDISLRELLSKVDECAPIIPDAVTHYYMTKSGLPPPPQTDPRLARLLALATQKFIADVAADAYQYSRIRASNSSANNPMGSLGAAAAAGGQPGAGPGGGGGGGGGGAAGAGGGGGGGAGGGAAGGKPGGANAGQGPGGAPLGIQRPGFGGGGQGSTQNRTVLTMEDLGMAVGEYGVNIKRSEFYR